MIQDQVTKKCPKCKEVKLLTEYSKCERSRHQKERYGVQNRCKACCKLNYLKNKEKYLEQQKNIDCQM